MLKRTVVASVVLALSSTSALAHHHHHHNYKGEMMAPMAAPAMPCGGMMSMNGFYIGANLGAQNTTFITHDNLGGAIEAGRPIGLAGIFGGYGALLTQTFYLGGELFANSTFGNKQVLTTTMDTVGGTNILAKTQWTYGASLIPGMMLNNSTLGYVRLNVMQTRFNVEVVNQALDATDNKSQTGYGAGVGLQTSLTQNFDMRAEYNMTKSNSFNTTNQNYKVAPAIGNFTLGIVYKFV